MSKVAGKIPGTAKLPSATRRMSRLLDNPAIRVREWYEPIARHWLEEQLRRIGEIRLTVDGTKIGFGHQLLIVAIAYRKRAIPIAWTWVKSSRGHSSSHKPKALLAYVRKLMSKGVGVFLVGDCEFGSIGILRQWMPGNGSTLCARNRIHMSGRMNRWIGKTLVTLSTNRVKVDLSWL
jgi:hypothetical protein